MPKNKPLPKRRGKEVYIIMPDKLVTKGIVLRETQTKEADKILTVLTSDLGRIAVIARGVKRRRRRPIRSLPCSRPTSDASLSSHAV